MYLPPKVSLILEHQVLQRAIEGPLPKTNTYHLCIYLSILIYISFLYLYIYIYVQAVKDQYISTVAFKPCYHFSLGNWETPKGGVGIAIDLRILAVATQTYSNEVPEV